MPAGLVNMADQFKGLPMEALIGGPLEAAVKANTMLARATAEFINTIGFNQVANTNTATQALLPTVPGAPRMVDFSFERPGVDQHNNRTIEAVKIRVPMLAIVPIPNLQIDSVDITFDMEVKSSTSSKESSDTSGSVASETSVGGWGFFSTKVSVKGSTASHKENTRTSDNSAKYHVAVKATNHGMPEGLARVLDIMADAAKPLDVQAYAPGPGGTLARDPATGLPTGTATPVPVSGEVSAVTSGGGGGGGGG